MYKKYNPFDFGCKVTAKTWNNQIFFVFSLFLFRKTPLLVEIKELLAGIYGF